jgi:adenylate cyclase
VVRGEIGDVKSQIVFSGEILYITSIIEKKCGELGQDILLSADIMQRISLPVIYQMKQAGKLQLDGQILDLYTIEELELEAV